MLCAIAFLISVDMVLLNFKVKREEKIIQLGEQSTISAKVT